LRLKTAVSVSSWRSAGTELNTDGMATEMMSVCNSDGVTQFGDVCCYQLGHEHDQYLSYFCRMVNYSPVTVVSVTELTSNYSVYNSINIVPVKHCEMTFKFVEVVPHQFCFSTQHISLLHVKCN